MAELVVGVTLIVLGSLGVVTCWQVLRAIWNEDNDDGDWYG